MTFDENFARFWSLYPRRDENPPISRRKDAYKKLQRIIGDKGATWDQILDGVRLYATSDKVLGKTSDGRIFICMPITWLNQARWEEEYQEPVVNFREIPREHWTDDHWRKALGDVSSGFMKSEHSEEKWPIHYYGPRPPHRETLVPAKIQQEYKEWWSDLNVERMFG